MSIAVRLVPNPLLSAAIVALWMALAQTMDLGTLLLAVLVALVIPIVTRSFWSEGARLVNPHKAPLFIARVLRDIVVANGEVARLVLGPIDRLSPAFVEVPLAINDPFVATVLGSIVSLTPGTVSVDIDRKRNVLLVHALYVPDEALLIANIKARYEAPLREIFAC
jgi:multicomponent K+:H+ antiporter subunit E